MGSKYAQHDGSRVYLARNLNGTRTEGLRAIRLALSTMPRFAALDAPALTRPAANASPYSRALGAEVFNGGSAAEIFYVIEQERVLIIFSGRVIAELEDCELFGELGSSTAHREWPQRLGSRADRAGHPAFYSAGYAREPPAS